MEAKQWTVHHFVRDDLMDMTWCGMFEIEEVNEAVKDAFDRRDPCEAVAIAENVRKQIAQLPKLVGLARSVADQCCGCASEDGVPCIHELARAALADEKGA
jgi:hypothetical protein